MYFDIGSKIGAWSLANTIKTKLLNTIPKQDWGMIWCK